MNSPHILHATTNIYDSQEAKGFDKAEQYPIAWEVIFSNDATGKQFAADLQKTLAEMPRERGYLLDIQGSNDDIARSVECVFADQHSFRKVVNKALSNMAIYDDQQDKVIPKLALIEQASKLTQKEEIALAI